MYFYNDTNFFTNKYHNYLWKLMFLYPNKPKQFTFSFSSSPSNFLLIISCHFSSSENLEEFSSSSSWLVNQKHSKKRRKDRIRLKSPSLTLSTAARTRPLQSFQKRKLYRLSPTFYWAPQVRKPSEYKNNYVSISVFHVTSAYGLRTII